MIRSFVTAIAATALAACGSTAKTPTPPTSGSATADGAHEHGQHHDQHGGGHDHHGAGHDGHDQPPPDAPPAPDPAQVKAALLAAETAAYEAAKPVFGKYCAGCHQQGGKKASAKKLGHLDITTYPFGGHHAGEVGATIRTSLGVDGSKPTMPYDKPGSLTAEELELVVAWSKAFDASHAGGAHQGLPGHEHHH